MQENTRSAGLKIPRGSVQRTLNAAREAIALAAEGMLKGFLAPVSTVGGARKLLVPTRAPLGEGLKSSR